MVDESEIVGVFGAATDAVRVALGGVTDWRRRGDRAGQYDIDVLADAAALGVLRSAGFAVLSEESGLTEGERPVLVVVDPVDGSTNASRGIPWYATSLCAVDGDGPLVSLVTNLATGETFQAVRGQGAARDGAPIVPSTCTRLDRAVVGLSGYPGRYLGWRQYRVLGAAALDLCSVAVGRLDAYLDCSRDAHGPWDYLGALLVCEEAGAPVEDLFGRELICRLYEDRRTPLAASSTELLEALRAAATAV